MKTLNVLKLLEANKENRTFYAGANRQTRVRSILNPQDEQQPAKTKAIRVTRWNKNNVLKNKLQEEPRRVSYDAPRGRADQLQNYAKQLKNRSLTNIQMPAMTKQPSFSLAQTAKSIILPQSIIPQQFPYHDEILYYIIEQAKLQQGILNYKAFLFQSQVTDKMRAVLLNWIIEVHYKYRLTPETLFLTMYIIDRYLEIEHIPRQKFQLFGVASFFIAAKYNEMYSIPKSRDLAVLCENIYTKDDVLKAESSILLALNFTLTIVTPVQILEHVNKGDHLSRFNIQLNQLGCLKYGYLQGNVNNIVIVSILISDRHHQKQSDLTMFDFDMSYIANKATELLEFWQSGEAQQLYPSLFKKYGQSKFQEISKLRIESHFP